ncbi:hypothetical protein QAD02_019217 [Eretmocerus hayati]|uniref:Uncharacterized protein n=1 Tax=Eretmocerus hayati TaxID=131215 RepID=A0ACC2PIK1_9HYME|nr:hypothetical protein QAD02_019217 [Eretmocerus hayati]
MLNDLYDLKSAGADGFVFGALTSSGHIDETACRRIIEAASPLPVTFHRAFDEALQSPLEILDIICSLGFSRLLTSGRQKSADAGVDLIADMIEHCSGKIVVMPGAGVQEGNLRKLREKTKAKEFHGSAKSIILDGNGANAGVTITDADKVRKMKEILKQF